MYLDDIFMTSHNNYCGELLAVNEFNQAQSFRKIEHNPFMVYRRIFKNAKWIRHMYYLHVLDHPARKHVRDMKNKAQIDNPYLG